MQISKIYQQRLLILFSIVMVAVFITNDGKMGTYGINKTVGWAWDLLSINFSILIFSSILFLFTYLILSLLKYRINKIFILVHLVLMILIMVLFMTISPLIILILNILAIAIFFTNLVWTIIRAKKL